MFGPLGGLPVNATAAKAGTGLGDTYTFTGSASYVLSPTFLVDAYFGVTTIEVLSEPDRIDENLGRDYLGIPGTNGRQPALRRLAALHHQQLLQHRLRRQQPLALHRRQLAGAVHRQRDVDEGRAHLQVRRRHRPPGAQPARARRRLRQVHVRRRTNADSGRTGREPVQQLRRVPARPADRHLEERDSLRERLHAQPQLAVQLLRQGSVAADAEPHRVARSALRPLSDGDADDQRAGALRSRDQPDADLRRGHGADRLRLRHGPRQPVAARRRRLPPDEGMGRARRLRHQLRPVPAGVRPQHPRQLSVVHLAERAAAERAAAGGTSGERHSRDRGSGRQRGRHPGAAQRQRARVAGRTEAGLHSLVERRRSRASCRGASPARPATWRRASATSTRSWMPTPARSSAPATPAGRCSFASAAPARPASSAIRAGATTTRCRRRCRGGSPRACR